MRFGGNAQKHPCSHTVEDQSKQEEQGVENGKDHSLQHVVAGAGAVGVGVIAGEERERQISFHRCSLKGTTAESSQVDCIIESESVKGNEHLIITFYLKESK